MKPERGGMTAVVLACCALGAVTVATTLSLAPGRTASTPVASIATEEYGRRLIAQTSEFLGPDVADPKMRYSSSHLACASCHLGAGTEPGTLTLLQATEHFPRFSGRVGAKTDIEDRVNECMQRSMNGKPLPRDSAEMIAMAARHLDTATLHHFQVYPGSFPVDARHNAKIEREKLTLWASEHTK